MKSNFIYCLVISVLCVIASSCKNDSSIKSKINIAEINFSGGGSADSKKGITDEERKILFIDSIDVIKEHPNSEIIRGAKMHEGKDGRMEALSV